MAHRKPLGTTFTSTFDWSGDDPYLHDALVSTAGTWWRIVGLEETRSLREALRLPVEQRHYKLRVMLERVADQTPNEAGRVEWPDGYTGAVHEFHWYPRDKRRA